MGDKRMPTCGDCIHADVCEEAETLVCFSRKNKAYCGMFLSAADAVEVVRCKDCTHFDGKWFCKICGVPSRKPDDFCSYGERKDNG